MEETLKRLTDAGVRFVLIGGQAMRLEGMPRTSMDWDLYVPPRDARNMDAINNALSDDIDVPVVELGPRGENAIQTYQTPEGILQFHLGGPGLPPFDVALARAVRREIAEGIAVPCLAAEDLLTTKERVNRPQDQDDILFLRAKLGR
jgi:predicted nucleotidyltransferase